MHLHLATSTLRELARHETGPAVRGVTWSHVLCLRLRLRLSTGSAAGSASGAGMYGQGGGVAATQASSQFSSTRDAPLPVSMHAPAGSRGAGAVGVAGLGLGLDLGAGSGQGTGAAALGPDSSTSSFSGFDDEFDPMVPWPRHLGVGAGGGSSLGPANHADGMAGESATGGDSLAGASSGVVGISPTVPEIVQDLIAGACAGLIAVSERVYLLESSNRSASPHTHTLPLRTPFSFAFNRVRNRSDFVVLWACFCTGTCFTEGDFDLKHRDMMLGFSPVEASLFIETARQQLLVADKAVIREQQGAYIHQTLLKAKQHVKRQLGVPKAAGGEMSAAGIAGRIKVDLKGEGPQSPLRQALHELCQGTCVDLSDVDKQHVSMLQGLPPQDIMTMVRIAKNKLSRIPRGETRSPAGLLHSVLSSARDDLKRAKRESAGGGLGGMMGGAGAQQGVGPGGATGTGVPGLAGGAAAGQGAGRSDDGIRPTELHASVRKVIKEVTSQTCFEDVDFERAHCALLAGLPPTLACFVLRSLKTRLSKFKRREHRSPPLFLLGALQAAARTAQLQHGGAAAGGGGGGGMGGTGLGGGEGTAVVSSGGADPNAEMVERLRAQIRGLGATPDL